MTFALAFWILMLLWAVLFGIGHFQPQPWSGTANGILLFLVILLLGWQVFGAPLK